MGKTVERILVTNVTGANTGTSISTIVNGDILIMNRTMGTALTGTPTVTSAEGNDEITIMQGLGPEGSMKMLASFPIKLRNVTKATLTTYVAPQEKVMTIPFGTTVINSNSEYQFDVLYLNSIERVLQQKPQLERYNYVTSTNATQAELAFAMAARAGNDKNANISRLVEVNSDGTFTASSGGSFTVTQYSKTITVVESSGGAADAGLYNSDASTMVVGNILRIGGTTSGFGEYMIASITGAGTALATITLNEVFQQPTATVIAANVGVMTAATTYSLVITGLPIVSNTIDLYDKVNFDVTLFEVDGPILPVFIPVVTTPLLMGIGFWQQVKDKEYLSSGYLGVQNRTQWPGNQLNPPTHAVVGNTYDLLTIEHYERVVDGLNGVDNNPKITTIAFYNGATTKRTAVVAILTSLLNSVGVYVG